MKTSPEDSIIIPESDINTKSIIPSLKKLSSSDSDSETSLKDILEKATKLINKYNKIKKNTFN